MGRTLISSSTHTVAARPVTVRPTAVPPEQPGEPEALWRELVGRHLRDVRGEQGRILTEVAADAGVSPQYLSEIERGRKEPSSEILSAVAGALGLTLLDVTRGVGAILERTGGGAVTPVGGLVRGSAAATRSISPTGRAHLRLAS
jgi:transcriptional regulator with XRE-family HTH domain